jgi:DNA-directed RNA polymerase specialized sigma subunit, sigma24 homolog
MKCWGDSIEALELDSRIENPHQREALILASVEGMAYKDIAKKQGVAESTAHTRIKRAKAAYLKSA